MKRRILTIVMSLLMCIAAIGLNAGQVYAEDMSEDIGTLGQIVDGSELTNNTESHGSVTPYGEGMITPRATYIKKGTSDIEIAGNGKIKCGGTTTASGTVSLISIGVKVQQYSNGSWKSYDGWTASKNNASSISSYKTLTVPKGYYYRVVCSHGAGGESSTSNTSGLWVG